MSSKMPELKTGMILEVKKLRESESGCHLVLVLLGTASGDIVVGETWRR